MRTFISQLGNTCVIDIAAGMVLYTNTSDDNKWCKEYVNKEKAHVLHALATYLDFDPSESSGWTKSQSDAVDQAFSFIDLVFDLDNLGALSVAGAAVVIVDLSAGRTVVLRDASCVILRSNVESLNDEYAVVDEHGVFGRRLLHMGRRFPGVK